MNQFQEVAGKIIINDKTPILLTIVSCTGVIATAVLAARAAPKASRIIEALRNDEYYDGANYDKIPTMEIVKHTWRVYIPAVSVGLATIGTIITMNQIADRNAALLTAGATLASTTLKNYQEHVVHEIGAEKESRIRDKIAKNSLAESNLPEADMGFVYTDGDVMCYDSLSGRYFKHNIEKIRAVENDLNHELLSEMTLPLNALYDALGLESIEIGEILGFNIDNMIDIHYSAQLSPDKKPVLVLSFINMPAEDYTTHIR